MYRIHEIFHSLQGEGFHSGTPAVFVRFSGCNLRCHFCDTDHREKRMLTAEQIVAEVLALPSSPLLVLTGGEPSLFIDEALVTLLKHDTGMMVAVETNGTRPLPAAVDWVTLSPKDAFEGGDAEPCLLRTCDELKVVYTGQDLAQYDHIQANHRFLQPCFSPIPELREQNLRACVQAVLRNPLWRLSLQIHRILGLP